jgi:hypothetical protein
MRFIQLAGTPRSGKTSIILHTRNLIHKAGFYNEKLIENDEPLQLLANHNILFLGEGIHPDPKQRKRLTGFETIGRSIPMLEDIILTGVANSPYFKKDLTVVFDSIYPVFLGAALDDHEKIMLVNKLDYQTYQERGGTAAEEEFTKRRNRFEPSYLKAREKCSEYTEWEIDVSLDTRVKYLCQLLKPRADRTPSKTENA